MKTSLNQLRKELEAVATAHLQINNFFWGDFLRAYKEVNQTYPLMVAYTGNGGNNTTYLVGQTLTIIIADKTFEGYQNLNDTESDTLQVIRDIYNVIHRSPRWRKICTIRSSPIDKFINRGGDDVAGHFMTITLDLKDSKSYCNLPMENYDFEGSDIPLTVPATIKNTEGLTLGLVDAGETFVVSDSAVSNSDDSYIVSLAAEKTLEVPDTVIDVKNTEGTTIGSGSLPSVTGGEIVVPDVVTTLNTVPFLNIPAGTSEDIVLQDQNTDPIVPASVVANVITVNVPVESIGFPTQKTGQTFPYWTGDDGNKQAGREVDILTLGSPNPFGNTDKLVDFFGGQVYANGIVLDFSTRKNGITLGYALDIIGGGSFSWYNCSANSEVLSLGGFSSGWRLCNRREGNNLIHDGVGTYVFNYPPWNLSGVYLIWLSTTRSDGQAVGVHINNQWGSYIPNIGKATLGYPLACRYFTDAEIGI